MGRGQEVRVGGAGESGGGKMETTVLEQQKNAKKRENNPNVTVKKRSTNWQVQNRHGNVKNSIGNGEAKELICTIHRNELRQGGGGMVAGGKAGTGWRG